VNDVNRSIRTEISRTLWNGCLVLSAVVNVISIVELCGVVFIEHTEKFSTAVCVF